MEIKENIQVPYGKTVHGEEEIEAVVKVLRTSTQMGKHVRELEEKVAALFDKQHGIMVNSGSSANYLATWRLLHPSFSVQPCSSNVWSSVCLASLAAPHTLQHLASVEAASSSRHWWQQCGGWLATGNRRWYHWSSCRRLCHGFIRP